jgi:hypothetical protein
MDASLLEAVHSRSTTDQVGLLDEFAAGADLDEMAAGARQLYEFSADTQQNVYARVRALFWAHALYRYHLPRSVNGASAGLIPYAGQTLLLSRRYVGAMESFLGAASSGGLSDALCSALAAATHGRGFQLLAAQVQRAVRSLDGNRWMFRTGHALDQPLRVRQGLLDRGGSGLFPVLVERTPVRMDLSHSGWSDIFFLGMDFPEGARVLNVSIDLAVRGRDAVCAPPITCFLRVIDEPVLRLVSVDLGASADLAEVAEVFNFGRDYLGLLKAAVVAAGIVPPGLEGSGQPVSLLMEHMVGPGLGLELASQVNDIPKGSRLAVSTNLLAGLIAVCMRATGQVASLSGELADVERRRIAGRAILGEWLGGSGGGWQDSGGLWPGIKLIEGVVAAEGDVEWGSSRGRLLPRHSVLGLDEVPERARRALEDSLILVHGGMAANVGPILEMVTEKFLLGTQPEWRARQELIVEFDAIVAAVQSGDMRELGRRTTRCFFGPLATIVPWVSNLYTETLIADARAAFGDRFWGFWMLGGMSGGGMGFIVDPSIKEHAEAELARVMLRRKRELESALPFAMDPVVYRFAVNGAGSAAELRFGKDAIMSPEYYVLQLPKWHESGSQSFSRWRRLELEAFSNRHLTGPRAAETGQALVQRLVPGSVEDTAEGALDALLERLGFDRAQHERIREDLRAGRIGLAKNRLPAETLVEDVKPSDVVEAGSLGADVLEVGQCALERGEAAVLTLAAGSGSRWTQGAGTVKAINPFAKLSGKFRTFIEVHLAKSRRTARSAGVAPAHLITTSYLTHEAIAALLDREGAYGYPGTVRLSPGRSIGLRLVPTARDLRFAWEQSPEQILEERKQKVRESVRGALIDWAMTQGEASDYRDNVPSQCLHPVGHWYEFSNLLLNGTLRDLLSEQPQLKYLLLHNIDTLGADLAPALLGRHIAKGSTLSFEVIPRRIDDRGGGLARVGGRVRLVEGLAFPREDDESRLRYYNSLTCWISIDPVLAQFGVERETLGDVEAVRRGVRNLAAQLPTYVALKEVKRRWGNAQEDVFPVAQFEKLWGDMSALANLDVEFFVVPRYRGQQLKAVAQLDGWMRDGSARFVEGISDFG